MRIDGREHRVAARDYLEIEHADVYLGARPAPQRPGLIACPACEREGLAPTAAICPDCQHDFTIERLAFYQRGMRYRGLWAMTAIGAILTVLHLFWLRTGHFGPVMAYVLGMYWSANLVLWLRYYFDYARPPR
jgi:hypothetical protein